jgi:hypothetical protein
LREPDPGAHEFVNVTASGGAGRFVRRHPA